MLVTTAPTTLFIITWSEAAGITNNSAYKVTFFNTLCDVIFGHKFVRTYVEFPYGHPLPSGKNPLWEKKRVHIFCVRQTQSQRSIPIRAQVTAREKKRLMFHYM